MSRILHFYSLNVFTVQRNSSGTLDAQSSTLSGTAERSLTSEVTYSGVNVFPDPNILSATSLTDNYAPAAWTWSPGKWTFDRASLGPFYLGTTDVSFPGVQGTTYKVVATIENWSETPATIGNNNAYLGSWQGTVDTVINGNGTYTAYITDDSPSDGAIWVTVALGITGALHFDLTSLEIYEVTLQAQSSTLSGTAERSLTSSGILDAQSSTLSGTAERVIVQKGTNLLTDPQLNTTDVTATGSTCEWTWGSSSWEMTTGALRSKIAYSPINSDIPTVAGKTYIIEYEISGSNLFLANCGAYHLSTTVDKHREIFIATTTAGIWFTPNSPPTQVIEYVNLYEVQPLSAQSSTLSGTAERSLTSSGTLDAQSSTLSGIATRGEEKTSSGTLDAQSSTLSGTAERSLTSSGTLDAQSSTLSGTAERSLTSSGTLDAQSSTLSGIATRGKEKTSLGTLDAQSSTINGYSVVGRGIIDTFYGNSTDIVGRYTEAGNVIWQGSTGNWKIVSNTLVPHANASASKNTYIDVGTPNFKINVFIQLKYDPLLQPLNNSEQIIVKRVTTTSSSDYVAVYFRRNAGVAGTSVLNVYERINNISNWNTGTVLTGFDFNVGINVTIEVSDTVVKVYPTADSAQYNQKINIDSKFAGKSTVTFKHDLLKINYTTLDNLYIEKIIKSSGTLDAQSSTLSGTAERSLTSSGTLDAQSSTLSGTAERSLTSSGTLDAQSSTLSGIAEKSKNLITVVGGSLVSQSSTVSGTVERILVSAGYPLTQNASISGTAEMIPDVDKNSTGALIAQSASVFGTAKKEIDSSGSLYALAASISGIGILTLVAAGVLVSSDASIAGVAGGPYALGDIVSQTSSILGFFYTHTTSGPAEFIDLHTSNLVSNDKFSNIVDMTESYIVISTNNYDTIINNDTSYIIFDHDTDITAIIMEYILTQHTV